MPIDNGETPSIGHQDNNNMRTQDRPKKPQERKTTQANGKSNEYNQETNNNDMEVKNTPTSFKSLKLARANMVKLLKEIKSLSAKTMDKITTIETVDKKALLLIAKDNKGNETGFDEKHTLAQVKNEENQQNSENYFKAMMSEAAGVINMKTGTNHKARMKHPLGYQRLNEVPKIYTRQSMPINNGIMPKIAHHETNHKRTEGPKKPRRSKTAKAEKSNEINQETNKNDKEVENIPTRAKSLYLIRARYKEIEMTMAALERLQKQMLEASRKRLEESIAQMEYFLIRSESSTNGSQQCKEASKADNEWSESNLPRK